MRPWTAQGRADHSRPLRASMGPRPCGRGRRRRRRRTASTARFNGATALRPWTVVPGDGALGGRDVLQWGHGLAAVDGSRTVKPVGAGGGGFNGATALRPWTEKAGRAPSLGYFGFNGATALRPWTADYILQSETGHQLQWGHGLAAVDGGWGRRSGRCGPGCFNGATALRPWTAS